MPPRESLDAHDIYFRNEETLESLTTCPTELKDLFKLIVNVRDLKFDHFGGYETIDSDLLSIVFNPRQQYEKELKNEAIQLSADCNDKRRPDDIENKWVQTLEPVVFYRFDREQEERFKRDRHHHCFICRKHYPVKSRPLISRTSERGVAVRVEKWSEDSEEHLCQQHLNLPNFDTVEQLAYPEFEKEQKKVPDLTIGLLSYDPRDWSDLPDIRIREDDRVRLFDQRLLRRLEAAKYLEPPFILPGSSTKRVSDLCLAFPFGFWEAKREDGGYDHQSAQKQNALKVKMILAWQDKVSKRADVPWDPLVWYFSSVGSKWEIHACHFQGNPFAAEGRVCLLRRLWSGDSANLDKALQLLYLVDIIALWGEHNYKPFAGACISRLQAKLENNPLPHLEDTLLARKLEINSDNFSWLALEQNTGKARDLSDSISRDRPTKARSQSQSRAEPAQSPDILQEIGQLSLAAQEMGYIIPERDLYIWLLDRDLDGEDLLIIRVDEGGSILPPLLIFDEESWERDDFRYVVKEEQERLPDGVVADFRSSRTRRSYIEKCVARAPGYFREPQCQFCAIIPLESGTYRRQLLDEDAWPLFGRFEQLLGLPELIDAAQGANKKWCRCQTVYNDHSPNMVLCDNVKCPMGWYHNRCVGLEEDFSADIWICNPCLEKWDTVELTSLKKKKVNKTIREASDYRIQRIKTLSRVWNDHQWPSQEKVRQLIDRMSCGVNVRSKTYDTADKIKFNGDGEARCWAILKGSPKVMRAIRPAKALSSLQSNQQALNLAHRKSDCDLPSDSTSHGLVNERSSNQLAVPQRSHYSVGL